MNNSGKFINTITGSAFLDSHPSMKKFTSKSGNSYLRFPDGATCYLAQSAVDMFNEVIGNGGKPREAFAFLAYSDIVTPDGETVPTLYKAPEEVEPDWEF